MNNTEYKPGQLETPIAFMIFNRPEYTKAVFAEIQKAQPKKLFIVADGPRTPSEEAVCKETRAIVENIDWPCEIHRNYAEKNLGLKERFRSGLNWFFENVEQGIILEDDCLPHPSFFRFTSEMLERYKNEEQIMMITGDNFVPDIEIKGGYAFSKFFSIWGWATWRRAWRKYDVEMKEWGRPQGKKFLYKLFPTTQRYMRTHMIKIFNESYTGSLKTWDVQWLYACLVSGGLCIIPRVNLISNIGIIGTHSEGGNQNLPTFDIYNGKFTHPSMVAHNEAYDNAFYEKNFKPRPLPLLIYLRYKIIAILVQYKSIKKLYRFLLKINHFVLAKISWYSKLNQ